MAIYREPQSRPRRQLILIGAVIVVVLIIIALFVSGVLKNTSKGNAPGNAGPEATITADLARIATSLDLFSIEYPKISAGSAPSQTGAPGAVDTALSALATLPTGTLNPDALAALSLDLNKLKQALSTTTPPDLTQVEADAQTQLQRLQMALPTSTSP